MIWNSVRIVFSSTSDRLGPRTPLFSLLTLFVAEIIWQGVNAEPRSYYDTWEYQGLARALSVFDTRFWLTMRPAGMLLFYDLFGSDPRSIVAAQIVLHMVGWGLLSVVLYEKSSNRIVGFFSAAAVLMIALSPQVSRWNYVLLPESTSLSLIPIVIAVTLDLADRGGSIRLASLLILLGISSTLRDLNAFYILSFSAPLAVAWGFRRISWHQFALSLVFLVGFSAFASFSANNARHPDVSKRITAFAEKRWYGPFLNTMGSRLLADETAVEYFVEIGMPVNDSLLAKRGMANVLMSDPDLADFRDWAINDGRIAYMQFLVTHPGYVLQSIWDERHEIFNATDWPSNEKKRRYVAKGFRTENLFPYAFNNAHVYAAGLLLIIAAWIMLLVGQRPLSTPRIYTAFAMLTGVPVLAIVGYHGDGMDVFRH
ncbi:hypothetical protein MK489_23200, partial [Myxococcota bacterium]|nr:hypothetical protein [Myxococcota bacterium]